MKYRAPLTAAAAFLVTLAPSAVAQNPEIKQQIQQSVAANKQRLARYTWREQQTVSLKGEVKSHRCGWDRTSSSRQQSIDGDFYGKRHNT
jgi:hypothetical protein